MTEQFNSWPGTQADDLSDLDAFGGQYEAKGAFRPNLEALANGDYDFEITDAKLDRINTDRILRIGIRTSTGKVVEWTHWLNRQEGVNRLGAELVVLGIDADKWGPQSNRPLSVELPKAVTKLPGRKFRATKTSRQGTGQNAGKTFHDLSISCPLDGRPMPPLTPPAAQPAATTNGSRPAFMGTAPTESSDIPF